MATLLSPTGSFSGRYLAPFVCPSPYCNIVPSVWGRRLAAGSLFVVELRCRSPDNTGGCRTVRGRGTSSSGKAGEHDHFGETQAPRESPPHAHRSTAHRKTYPQTRRSHPHS